MKMERISSHAVLNSFCRILRATCNAVISVVSTARTHEVLQSRHKEAVHVGLCSYLISYTSRRILLLLKCGDSCATKTSIHVRLPSLSAEFVMHHFSSFCLYQCFQWNAYVLFHLLYLKRWFKNICHLGELHYDWIQAPSLGCKSGSSVVSVNLVSDSPKNKIRRTWISFSLTAKWNEKHTSN